MARIGMPAIYLLSTHINPDDLPQLEGQIPTLTFDIKEAVVVLGRISKKERAMFELRRRGIITTEIVRNCNSNNQGWLPPAKRRRVSSISAEPARDSPSRASVVEIDHDAQGSTKQRLEDPATFSDENRSTEIISVVHLDWFIKSRSEGRILPLDEYIIYQGHKTTPKPLPNVPPKSVDILRRARGEGENAPVSQNVAQMNSISHAHSRTSDTLKRPALLKETTSEHDRYVDLPPIPKYLHTTYSCERPTPFNPPNDAFIEELKRVRTTRALTGDKVGVRAYSTCIASLAAYPYLLSTAQEVSRLPGCGPKIAVLYQEWSQTGQIQENEMAATDARLIVLTLFYEIWGVAETTAREFYNKGWRDLDDVVEFGWSALSRVQQIGVKYYEEFLSKIPRVEVEHIGNTILTCSNKRRKGFQMVIVGGYRRGKQQSGDVDVVLSHPDLDATRNFVEDLVTSLENDGFITHTLILSTKNSERGQAPLAWKGEDRAAGSGFDTLDKALVVWQDPVWDKTKAVKNPNPHRRVDIIISPWKTAGCAVIGWSGGTTFQRDLRRYCKAIKSLKFDSSGIRSRIDGQWVDLESVDGVPAPDLLTAEKRVFEGLGLTWRPPTQRCTG